MLYALREIEAPSPLTFAKFCFLFFFFFWHVPKRHVPGPVICAGARVVSRTLMRLWAITACTLAVVKGSLPRTPPVISTTEGPVIGTVAGAAFAYLGIPCASPSSEAA